MRDFKIYPLHEMFGTFQGEGTAMGLPAFFIRLFGCPVHCTFCDSAGTWHPDYVPDNVSRLSAADIATAAQVSELGIAVVTGGEPAIHDLSPLSEELRDRNVEVHLETSGAFEIRGYFHWIVLSPKTAAPPIRSAVARANEFKFVIEVPGDIEVLLKLLKDAGFPREDDIEMRHIWLHPEWSQRTNIEVLRAISDAVKKGKGLYRAGWQIHKLYQVDAMDPRALPLTPLGGNPLKGY